MVRNDVPRKFVWRAPVWQADLDAFGEVRNASLLRLLQESATRASSDAGFDASYYERTGTMWLIRRTTLRLEAPARYGDHLEVRTWIADFRRVRSLREYEVRAGERLVARASTDWVYVDRAQGRPRRISAEWERVFGLENAASTRAPFADAAPSPTALTFARRVELHDLDTLRHVNNANYVSYVEQAALDAARAVGWSLAAQIDAGGRLRAVAHDLEYLDAALPDETLSITTWPIAVDAEGVERHTHVHRGDRHRPLLHARSRYRWTSDDPASRFPAALEAALRAA
jgi:YbgC/YbaW family acyl-CoA thioester hydrolase